MQGRLQFEVVANKVFAGKHAAMLERISFKDDAGDAIPCDSLTQDDVLAGILEKYRDANHPCENCAASASLWSQWYFGLMLPGCMALAADGAVNVTQLASVLSLRLNDKYCPSGFNGRGDLTVNGEDRSPVELLLSFLRNHVLEVTRAIRRITGISEKVIHANVAVNLHYNCGQLDLTNEVKSQFETLYTESTLQDGAANPWYRPYAKKKLLELTAKRRVCCLRYQLSSVKRCAICPLSKSEAK